MPAVSPSDEVEQRVSRREWRATHKPPIRRGDPIFDLASWILPTGMIAMFIASFGGRRSPYLPPDVSAIAVAVCGAAMGIVLLAMSVRLLVKRDHAPLSISGGVALVIVSLLSSVVVLARSNGEISWSVFLMFIVNGACLALGAFALVVSVLRSPRSTV